MIENVEKFHFILSQKKTFRFTMVNTKLSVLTIVNSYLFSLIFDFRRVGRASTFDPPARRRNRQPKIESRQPSHWMGGRSGDKAVMAAKISSAACTLSSRETPAKGEWPLLALEDRRCAQSTSSWRPCAGSWDPLLAHERSPG